MSLENFSPSRGEIDNNAELISIDNYISDEKKARRFMQFCDQTEITAERTKLDYINGLKRLDDVFIPTDLSDYYYTHNKNITDKQRKGLLKFFNYLQTFEMVGEFNGYPLDLFKTNLRIAQKGEEKNKSKTIY